MQPGRRVTKVLVSRIVVETSTIDGDSPVDENHKPSLNEFPSTAGHGKSRGNLGGPPPKAKYFLTTDSEPVP